MPRICKWMLVLLLSISACLRGQEVVRSGNIDAQTIGRETAETVRDETVRGETEHNLDLAKLAAYIEQARSDWQVPGLAVAIVRDDQVLLSRGFGVKQVGEPEAVDQQTLFAIASNSKAFTSAALAILVDEGKLAWDDHVSRYLPWLKLKDPLATSDLRIRDLLCHRSGLGTFSGDLLWWGTSYSPRQVLERAVELEPAGPFRATYGYSNLMFLAAGQVIEVVSGMPWTDFIRTRLLEPLQMERTVTSVRDLVSRGNFATPHKTLADRSEPLPWMNWDTMAAAGGIISSADDMSQWLRLQLRHGALTPESRLFSEKQSATMWQAQMPISVTENYQRLYPSTHFRAYGLGWVLSDYQGRKVIGHGGGYDGMYSEVALVPEENLGVVVLTNSMTSISPAITYHILDGLLAGEDNDWSAKLRGSFLESRQAFQKKIETAITPSVEGTRPSHPWNEYAGTFRCPMYGDARVELEHDALVLKLLPNPDLVADLEHLHYDTFVIRWRKKFAWFEAGTVTFIANPRGKFSRLVFDVPNDDLWFYELKFERVE